MWAKGILAGAGVEVVVTDAANAAPETSYVIIVNHQSLLDIPVLHEGLPLDVRWLAKKELFAIPFFRLCMKRAGHIRLDRQNKGAAILAVRRAAHNISGGVCAAVFAEGTRSRDGNLLPFKAGGFLLAMDADVPILPVVIAGTGRILPRDSIRVTPGQARLRVLPPVQTHGLNPVKDRKDLMESVRGMIQNALREENERLP
jgi:1-acyl-sn-glycerol-3-phosphate acyltransferase